MVEECEGLCVEGESLAVSSGVAGRSEEESDCWVRDSSVNEVSVLTGSCVTGRLSAYSSRRTRLRVIVVRALGAERPWTR